MDAFGSSIGGVGYVLDLKVGALRSFKNDSVACRFPVLIAYTGEFERKIGRGLRLRL